MKSVQILPERSLTAAVQAGGGGVGRSLSSISPVAFLQLLAELLRELSLRRGRRGREEVEISFRDIRVREPALQLRERWG